MDILRAVFIALRNPRLFGNLGKCTFCTDRVSFLGYVVTPQGIEVDKAKIEAPKTVTQVRSFLGDEDISANVTPTSPPSTHIGPVTRARAHQLNYQVMLFLANPSNVHEHMMLPKIDTFVLLMSE